MVSDRGTTTIGTLIAASGGEIKTGPFGTILKAAEYSAKGVPVVSVREIGDGQLVVLPETPRVPETVTRRLPQYLLRGGDIIFARKGAVERSALVAAEQEGWFLGSDCIRLRLPPSCDPRFVRYQLAMRSHRNWIVRYSTGTTMPSLNEGIIRRIPLVLLPIEEQRAIAGILGALDDKIELNRKMNRTLEAMERVLFKSWFVDLEPVAANAEGQTLKVLAPGVAQLFPAHFTDSVMGPIPEAWHVSRIGDAVRVVGGSTPRTDEPRFWDGGSICWATPKDLSKLSDSVLLDTERKITGEGLSQISSGLLPVGTVLLSSRAPIGYMAIAEVPLAVNQGFIAMVCDGEISNHYVLRWTEENLDEILARAGGTTFAEISKANFRSIPVLVPGRAVINEFDKLASPLHHRRVANLREAETLALVRDAFLPQLLSGKIHAPQLEKLVEQAV